MELLQFSLIDMASKQLNMNQRRHIACGILRGVAAGHAVGIAHRDLKPANILFNHKYVPKVCDWGLSKYSGPGVCGTRKYAAPELATLDS